MFRIRWQKDDQLAAFRQAWHCGRSLSIGDSFDVALPAVAKPEGMRELPSFAYNSGDYELVITNVLQPVMESEAHWSLVCTADASLLPLESRSPPSLALSQKQLAGCENYAYNELKDLQGTVIPYYYGKHKLAMKNGEVARVLVLEHIHGISVEGWIDSFPEHNDAYEPRNGFPFYDTMLSQAKAVTKLALHGITKINKRGILHGDISLQNMLITPTADTPMHVVFLDFARCNIKLTERKLKELGHNERKDVMTFLTLCCMDHYEDLVDWAEVKGSLGGNLVYPGVFI
ncbi:hypothetical protein EV421DRAFT_1998471 [Armillaria borealis]|uniref:Uncharacterized protein n=1 Tax=Armillaria borealis TaxID=47425 RepID=A0AA39IZX9_9AGAR|nr:hypothetical protein EV421DRAFT_1998471 [Armillaria borealis]